VNLLGTPSAPLDPRLGPFTNMAARAYPSAATWPVRPLALGTTPAAPRMTAWDCSAQGRHCDIGSFELGYKRPWPIHRPLRVRQQRLLDSLFLHQSRPVTRWPFASLPFPPSGLCINILAGVGELQITTPHTTVSDLASSPDLCSRAGMGLRALRQLLAFAPRMDKRIPPLRRYTSDHRAALRRHTSSGGRDAQQRAPQWHGNTQWLDRRGLV